MSGDDIPLDVLRKKAAEASEFMRLFGTPSRLMLLCHIAQKERSVSEIQDELGLKQPGLSQQLAELRQAGVVKTRRESRQIHYSIADERIGSILDMLCTVFCGKQPKLSKRAARRSSPNRPSAFPLGEAAQFARLESTD